MTITLFILRLVSGLLLLGFLGTMGWLIYKDMQATAVSLSNQQRVSGYLRLVAGTANGLTLDHPFRLLRITSIGRATSNNLIINNDFASNRHALITRRGEQWWLQDMQSRNGTLLNGIPLEETAVISPGDIITIGDTQLKLES